MKYILVSFFLFFVLEYSYGQYPPPAGHAGTTAIYKDSSVIFGWAKHCSVIRGYVNISDTNITYDTLNHASYGDSSMALGIADGEVVSLGDGGSATLTFDTIISDHDGWDFAVFENGFADNYLEFGFVEVSSDGTHFVRFPSVSLTQTQVQIKAFDTLDTRLVNNLAGKYRVLYGTPFDLAQLKDSAGVDIHHVTTIRVVDVVGSILDAYARYDSQGHKINDPWPTPFNTCGFDLDAVGLVQNAPNSINNDLHIPTVNILPNPCSDQVLFSTGATSPMIYQIIDSMGQVIVQSSFTVNTSVDVKTLASGIYFVRFTDLLSSTVVIKKLIKL